MPDNVNTLTPEQTNNIAQLGIKLNGLGIAARFKTVEEGPVVTNYSFTLGAAVPIAKILNRAEDFALAMRVDSCIVQRIGGDIVLSVPNKERKNIDFKDNLYWYLKDEQVKKAHVPIPLGVSISGDKSFFDLADMPHALIAGSTGAGKSVFLANIITSLCYRSSSDDLNLYLVDTKRVDLPLFSELPHVKAIADSIMSFHKDVAGAVMDIVRLRLSEFQKLSVRNIHEYHNMGLHMAYVVLIIDELGDVLDLDKTLDRKKDGDYEGLVTVKGWLNQITRIARAAGVHIIACTQRSSVKVVDGDIKANLPCRIALRLPTGTDSRTILGTNGAENLLGKGDMLIQRPEEDTIKRYHGPYVSMNDITELIMNYNMLKDVIGK